MISSALVEAQYTLGVRSATYTCRFLRQRSVSGVRGNNMFSLEIKQNCEIKGVVVVVVFIHFKFIWILLLSSSILCRLFDHSIVQSISSIVVEGIVRLLYNSFSGSTVSQPQNFVVYRMHHVLSVEVYSDGRVHFDVIFV